VTPFPDLTRLLSAASFSRVALPLFDVFLAYLSTVLSSASRILFFVFRSLVRRARFSAGVSSLRARTVEEDVGAKTSSGASVLASDRLDGSADSRDAAGTSDTVVMLAFGCPLDHEYVAKRERERRMGAYRFRHVVRITQRVQRRTDALPHAGDLVVFPPQPSITVIYPRRRARLRSDVRPFVELRQRLRRLGVLEPVHRPRGHPRHRVPRGPAAHDVVEPALFDARLDAVLEGCDDGVGDDGDGAGRTVKVEVLAEEGVVWAGAGGGFAEKDPFFGADVVRFEGLDLGAERGEASFVGGHVWATKSALLPNRVSSTSVSNLTAGVLAALDLSVLMENVALPSYWEFAAETPLEISNSDSSHGSPVVRSLLKMLPALYYIISRSSQSIPWRYVQREDALLRRIYVSNTHQFTPEHGEPGVQHREGSQRFPVDAFLGLASAARIPLVWTHPRMDSCGCRITMDAHEQYSIHHI
jgi:hypothetical protein